MIGHFQFSFAKNFFKTKKYFRFLSFKVNFIFLFSIKFVNHRNAKRHPFSFFLYSVASQGSLYYTCQIEIVILLTIYLHEIDKCFRGNCEIRKMSS